MPGLDTLGANGDGDGCLVSEYRTTCFIDRDKIRLHFEPPLHRPATSAVLMHESRHCRNLTEN